MRQNDLIKAQKKCRAFTLMEMMVTVVLIGLTATFVVVNLGDTDGKKALHEARQFAALVNHVLDEAILLGKPIGIEVNDGEGSYQFKIYDGGWTSPEKDGFLRERKLPERMQMSFQLLESTRPASINSQQKSKFTPSRVHDVLNESILDLDEEQNDQIDLYANQLMIVAEPTGLLPPFTLEVSIENYHYIVRLNEYGKAVVDDPANEQE